MRPAPNHKDACKSMSAPAVLYPLLSRPQFRDESACATFQRLPCIGAALEFNTWRFSFNLILAVFGRRWFTSPTRPYMGMLKIIGPTYWYHATYLKQTFQSVGLTLRKGDINHHRSKTADLSRLSPVTNSVHTANATQLDSWVASSVCIGLRI